MAHHKSAIKRIKTSQEARLVNRLYKKRMRRSIKALLSETDKEAAAQQLGKTISLIDKLAIKGIIHKNNAAHKKSSIMRYVNSL
jgi:small subunit ribosomal protein S20